jgi:hypothetical protein
MRQLLAVPVILALLSCMAFAQLPAPISADPTTSTDVFVMGGSDLVRPGLLPRVNLNIGVGHSFDFLNKDPFGNEITFSYTYENGGNHGFFHSSYGADTENVGIMKNFNCPWVDKVTNKHVSFYTWPTLGITSMTGNKNVENRLYLGVAFGEVIHFDLHDSIWVQQTWNKVLSLPGYPTFSFGYTYSF